jgi:hypothetical protein
MESAAAQRIDGEGFHDLLTNEIVLPSQFWEMRDDLRFEPEKKLMVAVLEEALATILSPSERRSEARRQIEQEAWRWFASDDRSGPFNFATICDVLGLDAERVRQVITFRMTQGQPFTRRRIQAGRGRHRVRESTRRLRRAA